MNPVASIRKSPWPLAVGMLAGLLVLVLGSVCVTRSQQLSTSGQPAFNTVVHWHDVSHDWLLVADGPADRLSVYSAVDGRPLGQLHVQRGLRDVDAMAQRDGRLFVIDDDGRQSELELPQLQLAAASIP
ncbi:hypothetical protein [Rhodanobacter sp. MP7CTX1]|uniref:hypothetical protein n=1 Tax=Rhodanobacter sp. MP7CTX1 TaxID=2723084 RepID=UPI00160D059E|nr:hypothetical protein [Rhodanobacter sp. MP7CTX1]MBB6187180.1 hypothetical protein [Rhodanobacter sp. MP7CTX1]